MTHDTAPATKRSTKPKPPALVRWAGLTAGLAIILVALLMLLIMPSLKSAVATRAHHCMRHPWLHVKRVHWATNRHTRGEGEGS